jgi:hypothetical protein
MTYYVERPDGTVEKISDWVYTQLIYRKNWFHKIRAESVTIISANWNR